MPQPVDPASQVSLLPLQADLIGFRYVNSVADWAPYDPYLGAVPALRECGLPYGLQSSLCTLRLLRSANDTSYIVATLDTSGWLSLTRQGLSPCKKRQAALGALTFGISRLRAVCPQVGLDPFDTYLSPQLIMLNLMTSGTEIRRRAPPRSTMCIVKRSMVLGKVHK